MCIAFCLFFFACSPVTMSTTQYTSGEILFEMEFDIASLSSDKKDKAYKLAKAYHNQLTTAYKQNLVTLFDNMYKDNENWKKLTTVEDKFTFIKGLYPRFIACYKDATNSFEFDGGKVTTDTSMTVGGAEIMTSSPTKIKVEIAFKSIYGYLAYFCPGAFQYNEEKGSISINSDFYSTLIDTPVMVEDSKTEETFFVTKIVETCSPFYYNKEQPKLLEDYKTYTKGTLIETVAKEELELTDEEANFVFSFVTPYSRVHSNGTIKSVDGGSCHTWTFDSIDGKTTIYRNYANQVGYYLVGIAVGVAVMLVAIVISFIKTKLDKKKALTKVENSQNFEEQSSETTSVFSNKNNEVDKQKSFETTIETPKKVRTKRASKVENIDRPSEEKKTKNSNSTNKTTRKRAKKVEDKKDMQDMTGMELLKAIDDLVNERRDNDEEK